MHFHSESSSHPVTVRGDLYRPEGKSRSPAVIVLHTCGGANPHVRDWGLRFQTAGYVALVVDSFYLRRFRRGCERGNFSNHVEDSLHDTLGAANYLRSLSFVEGDRIAVIGFSLGATAILSLPPESASRGIKAGVSYYPICQARSDGRNFFKDSKIPLLVFLGEIDDWSPASECVAKAEQFRKQGRTIEWKIYSGVHHGFDNESYVYAQTDRANRTMKYDKGAAADSWNVLKEFLEKNLQ